MYKYLEHEADMGIYAVGGSWPEVFAEAARAVFCLMYEIDKFKSQKSPPEADPCPTGRRASLAGKFKIIRIKVISDSIEGLLVEWINELLAQKDISELVLFDFKVDSIGGKAGRLNLRGQVSGIARADFRGQSKVEVKAATYSGLKCGRKKGEYYCQCLLDV